MNVLLIIGIIVVVVLIGFLVYSALAISSMMVVDKQAERLERVDEEKNDVKELSLEAVGNIEKIESLSKAKGK